LEKDEDEGRAVEPRPSLGQHHFPITQDLKTGVNQVPEGIPERGTLGAENAAKVQEKGSPERVNPRDGAGV
jgi:hypothetical protein